MLTWRRVRVVLTTSVHVFLILMLSVAEIKNLGGWEILSLVGGGAPIGAGPRARATNQVRQRMKAAPQEPCGCS